MLAHEAEEVAREAYNGYLDDGTEIGLFEAAEPEDNVSFFMRTDRSVDTPYIDKGTRLIVLEDQGDGFPNHWDIAFTVEQTFKLARGLLRALATLPTAELSVLDLGERKFIDRVAVVERSEEPDRPD